jgi:protein involved in polysaccharide export with SLBB domain
MKFRVVALALVLGCGASGTASAQLISRRPVNPFEAARSMADAARTPGSADSIATATPSLIRGLDGPVNPDEYVVGPGDVFIMVVRPMSTKTTLTVLPEGNVLLPNAGLVHAAGLTITQFRAELAKVLATFYHEGDFYLQLVAPRTFVVYALGDIKNPGPVQVWAPFRLDMVIEAAGGVLFDGSKRKIEIRDADGTARACDLVRFQRLGDRSQNPMLQEGQSVYVPVRGATADVVGEVWRTGTYEILPGETVMDLIRLGGGFTTNAIQNQMVLERLSDRGKVSISGIDPARADSIVVRNRDVIVVPDLRSFPGIDFVRVQGGGGRDGRIYLEKGETLASFLPRFIRLRNDFDLANSRIERHHDNGQVEFIKVDLAALVDGDTTASVPLKTGDVINIPPLDDVVFVAGEVVSPGSLDFQRGLPAGRYIAMAGGPSEAGSIDKIEIYDNRGNTRHGDRNSVVYRGETILVKRRTGVVLGNLFLGLVSLTSLFLSVYAVIRN